MAKSIYVGNLSYDATEGELRSLFDAHGTVSGVKLVTDRDTGRPRGFAFVDMENDTEADAAIEAINGQEIGGRTLNCNAARPREQRPSGGARSGGYGNNSGGGEGRW
jgi:RNA recognition motif-containing protein